jgi:hypothetical protein
VAKATRIHQLIHSNIQRILYSRIQGTPRTGKKVPESSTTATKSAHIPDGDGRKTRLCVPDSLYIPVFLPCLTFTELVDEYEVAGVSIGIDVECAVDRSDAPSSVLPRRPPSGSSTGPSSLLVLSVASGTASAVFREEVNGRRMAAMSASRGARGNCSGAWFCRNWFGGRSGIWVQCGSGGLRQPRKGCRQFNRVLLTNEVI